MISAELRRTVRTLYAFACGYCGVTETEVGAYLTIDHYQPLDGAELVVQFAEAGLVSAEPL